MFRDALSQSKSPYSINLLFSEISHLMLAVRACVKGQDSQFAQMMIRRKPLQPIGKVRTDEPLFKPATNVRIRTDDASQEALQVLSSSAACTDPQQTRMWYTDDAVLRIDRR